MASSSGRVWRMGAAALSSALVGGYYFGSVDEKDEESEHTNLQGGTSWINLASPARDVLLPIKYVATVPSTAQCEEATIDPSYPNLSRFGKHSYLKRYLTPEIYSQLKDKRTSNGVMLEDLIQPGISLPYGARPVRGCGVYAGDAESYQVFAPILVPILEDYHHFRMVARANPNRKQKGGRPNPLLKRQVTNLNPGYVLQQKLDPEGQYILHTRMRVARSVRGFKFSPVISRQERRQLESLFQECVEDWDTSNDGRSEVESIKGAYLRVMDMSNEQHDDLIQRHILFHDPDDYSISAGFGRDWPDARGIFLDHPEDPDLMIWLNAEDHFRVVSMSKGGDLLGVFTKLTKALTALEASLQQRGYGFCIDPRLGFLNTSPENLGTALRASVVSQKKKRIC